MSIKNIIKKSFYGRYLISELHILESKILPKLIDDKTAIKRYYKKHTGKELNLDNPVSFSEKLNWYKLHDRNPLMTKCADKYAVREYIKECGYEELLNELYGVYDNVDDIDINKLPSQFVLKAAHGSHMNIIVKNKNDINWKQAKLMMKSWLKQDIYWSGREWCYKDVPKRIIAEKYLEDETGELKDYKVYCYNGEPTYLMFVSGRYGEDCIRQYYDMNIELRDFADDYTNYDKKMIDLDINIFNTIIEISRKLSKPFQFVRVDYYYANNNLYFGELTFFDNGGYAGFTTEKDDIEFAKEWKIDKNENIVSNK